VHHKFFSGGFSEAEKLAARVFYNTEKADPLKQKRNLCRSNVLSEAFKFNALNFSKLGVLPNVDTVVLAMIQSGQYTFSPAMLAGSPLRPLPTQLVWESMHYPGETTRDAVGHVMYGKPSSIDREYGEIEDAWEKLKDMNAVAGELDCSMVPTLGGEVEPGYMSLDGISQQFSVKRAKRPVGLSAQVTGILERRRVANEARLCAVEMKAQIATELEQQEKDPTGDRTPSAFGMDEGFNPDMALESKFKKIYEKYAK